LSSFLEIFDQHWAGRLQHRARTMRKALELLEQLPQPQSILETGCMRELPTDEAAKKRWLLNDAVGRIRLPSRWPSVLVRH
jgi:hypothetical protein